MSRPGTARPPPARPPGRPRDLDKQQAILDAGWALFLEHGVEATPVAAIAARAGVSKVTLYSHYSDKAALFEAAVLREMERIELAQRPPETAGNVPVRDRLQHFGMGILAYLTSPPAVAFYGAIAGELRRHEGLAQAFHRLGPGRTRANLAALLEDAARRGELAPLDGHQAADELFGLWQGFTNFDLLLGIGADAIRADLPRRVARGVDLFLRCHGAG